MTRSWVGGNKSKKGGSVGQNLTIRDEYVSALSAKHFMT